MQDIDCLFIHVPEETGNGAFIGNMSMGLFAMADYLSRNGYNVRILNIAVEKVLDTSFSLEKYLQRRKVRVTAISLHWHFQLFDSINAVDRIKSVDATIITILGGFTSSYFADEILLNHENVDFIIRGEGEIPLHRLMDEISRKTPDYPSLPNLSWRKGNRVIHNDLFYVATESDINKLNFSNLELLEHYPVYLQMPIRLDYYSRTLLNKHKMLSLCVGRGCNVNCSYCGGSWVSQRIINNRDGVIFRSNEKVLQTIKDYLRYGIECLNISFDPLLNRKYYFQLFEMIRKAKIQISAIFDCWSIPSIRFIDSFKETFGDGKYSGILLSPDTGSEKVRKLNKGYFYTNKELLECLRVLKDREVPTELYFSFPLPGETDKDIHLTHKLIKRIKAEMGSLVLLKAIDLIYDPAAPINLFPERYISSFNKRKFNDYWQKSVMVKKGYTLNQKYDFLQNMVEAEDLQRRSRDCLLVQNYNSAIINAKAAIELDPNNLETYLILGLCYEKSGLINNALKVYTAALERFPNEGSLCALIANDYFELGEYDDSVKMGKRSLRLKYGEKHVHLLLGLCFMRKGLYENAIQELKKAERFVPKEPRITSLILMCNTRLNE